MKHTIKYSKMSFCCITFNIIRLYGVIFVSHCNIIIIKSLPGRQNRSHPKLLNGWLVSGCLCLACVVVFVSGEKDKFKSFTDDIPSQMLVQNKYEYM